MAEGKHAMEKGKKEVKQETKESKQNDEIIEIKKENDIKQNTIINYANYINEYNNLSWIKKLSKIFKKDNIKLLN